MPPKQKTVEKAKQKIVEDKTFGLKNKKGKKQQQIVKQISQQVKGGNDSEKKLKKEAQEKEAALMGALFKPVVEQKVAPGVDPKSVLCAFFKKGQCTKGDKCKFSHDPSVERKSEKRDIYSDARDDKDKLKEADTMENWDQAKLESVVAEKHAAAEAARPKTEIVCKYFLDALEKRLYGWFWVCPNGGDKCQYRHALPPGYVLKRDQKKEEKTEITIEELVDTERAALGSAVTKVTLESFLKWKQRKLQEKKEALAAERAKKKKSVVEGKLSKITGRDLFTFNPELATQDDDEAADSSAYALRPEEELLAEEQAAETEANLAEDDGPVDEALFAEEAALCDDDGAGPDEAEGADGEDDGEETGAVAGADCDDAEVDAAVFAGEDIDDIDDED